MRYLMTVESLVQSDLIAAGLATPPTLTATLPKNAGGKLRYAESRTTTTGTTTTSGSTYLLHRLPANACIKWGSIEGVGSIDLNATAPSVGVRQVAGSNTAVANAWTDVDIDDTGPHVFVGELGSQDTKKELWEWAGLTTNPGGEFDITLTLNADAVVAGVFVTKIKYIID